MKWLLTALVVVGTVTPSWANPPASPLTCAPVSTTDVTALFDRWNQSLATLDPAAVARNYAPNAVLLATVANEPKTSPEAIQAYFVEFLKLRPQGQINQRTVKLGCNTAFDVGTYTFSLTGADDKSQTVQARYTYIYERQDDGKWLIVHHHSSKMPDTAASQK
ncbi:SgcJ/EcaC family oxidoreductase [Synechococcus elongatus IITB7]|uniref:SgcJ/EcaC family oxidoreductase n=1 Tax=Synechococcus elongatus TaxID=32046 RepID=UPI0030D5BA25